MHQISDKNYQTNCYPKHIKQNSAKKKSTKLSDKNNIKQIFKHNKSTKFSDKKNIQKKSLKKETKILPWLSQVRWLPL